MTIEQFYRGIFSAVFFSRYSVMFQMPKTIYFSDNYESFKGKFKGKFVKNGQTQTLFKAFPVKDIQRIP